MSDEVITPSNPKGQAEHSRDQDRTLINARLQWMADLVCAILNAERPSAVVVKRPSFR
jgi:hypothetical protein